MISLGTIAFWILMVLFALASIPLMWVGLILLIGYMYESDRKRMERKRYRDE